MTLYSFLGPACFRGGKLTMRDGRGGEDNRLSGEGKKHADDTGDSKKTDQGKEKAKAITASFFRNRFADIRFSQWVCFMLHESMRGKLISRLTRFSNGRMKNLRPIHSHDQGDWRGRACVNGFPRQLSKRGG